MSRRWLDIALPVGVLACAVVAIVAAQRSPVAAQAWLAAHLFWTGLPVGALYLVLVHGLTGGAWGLTLRPALAAMLRTMPLAALFLVPVLFGQRAIFPGETQGGDIWLGRVFFSGRAVAYVVLWNVLALAALRRARPDGGLPPGVAWPALVLLFASTSLAAFDWLMALEPHWTSTIFGLLVSSGWVANGMAAAILVVAASLPWRMGEALDPPARILLALVCLWAYLSTVQLIVIWESDLSDEIPWYLVRAAGGWQWVALAIAVLGFVVPFLILLWRKLRRSPRSVTAAAASILAAHLAETWWLTVPDFGRAFGWADVLAVVAIGAAFLFVAGRDFDPSPALPPAPRDAAR